MNFSSAFKYPFQNFAKVLSVVLVLTIAFAVFMAMILETYDWSPLFSHLNVLDAPEPSAELALQPMGGATIIGILGLLLVAIASGFWLSGYSVEVIRSVMRGDEWMPAVEVGKNLKDGGLLFVSSVAYWLLFVVLGIAAAVVIGIASSIQALGGLVMLASMVVIAGAGFVMGWAYFVGMARFAAQGDYRAAWQIRSNMRIARDNWRKGCKLLLYMIAFSIVYGVVRGIADGVFGGILGGNLLAGLTLSIIIYYVLNLMQHFSTQVLIAQYAAEIGIRSDNYAPEKDKGKSGLY